jgi:hypothetical protein
MKMYKGSGCEAVGITDFGKRRRWIARLHLSVGSLHLPVGLQVGWVPWANLTSFSSWHLTLVVESLYDSGNDSCACLLTAMPAYWQLCLLTDSCACLLTTVAEGAVPAYWQLCFLTDSCACLLTAVPAYWQMCLLTDCCACLLTMVAQYHLVSLVLPIRTLDNPSLKPGPADTAHLSKIFHGFTQSLLGIRGIVPYCDFLSSSHKSCLDGIKKGGICILKPRTSVWSKGGLTDFQTLHHHFCIHGSVHRKSMLITVHQDAIIIQFLFLQTALQVSGDHFTHHQERILL